MHIGLGHADGRPVHTEHLQGRTSAQHCNMCGLGLDAQDEAFVCRNLSKRGGYSGKTLEMSKELRGLMYDSITTALPRADSYWGEPVCQVGSAQCLCFCSEIWLFRDSPQRWSPALKGSWDTGHRTQRSEAPPALKSRVHAAAGPFFH